MRVNYESQLPNFRERIASFSGVPLEKITISADIRYLYTFAPEKFREGFGTTLSLYFEALIRALDGLTQRGKDSEAQAALQKAFTNGVIKLEPDSSGKTDYCAYDFDSDGSLCMVFHPEEWAVNIDSCIGYEGNLLVTLDRGKSYASILRDCSSLTSRISQSSKIQTRLISPSQPVARTVKTFSQSSPLSNKDSHPSSTKTLTSPTTYPRSSKI